VKLKIITLIVVIVFLTNGIYPTDKKENNQQKIRIGYSIHLFKDVDIRDATVAIKMWTDELLENLGMEFSTEAKIYETNDDIISALKNNELEMISLSTLDYFEIEKKTNLTPTLITQVDGNPGDNYILVVRKESNYKNIKSLKGKTLLKPSGTFGKIIDVWATNLISEKNIEYSNFFSQVRSANKPSQALLPVFFRQADACIVTKKSFNTLAELNPQIKKDLVSIETSPTFPNGLMCINKNINTDTKEKIIIAAKTLSKSTSGKQILKLFKSEDIINFEDKYIFEIKRAYKIFQKKHKN